MAASFHDRNKLDW